MAFTQNLRTYADWFIWDVSKESTPNLTSLLFTLLF